MVEYRHRIELLRKSIKETIPREHVLSDFPVSYKGRKFKKSTKSSIMNLTDTTISKHANKKISLSRDKQIVNNTLSVLLAITSFTKNV